MEIPGDVMETARECVRNFDSDYVENWPDIIARAILAERQHCADVARTVDLFEGDKLKNSDPRETCAQAILNPVTP